MVDLLERLALPVAARHLPDQQQHRRRGLRGGVHARGGLGRARAAGDEAHGGCPAGPRLGHVGRAGLRAAGDQAQAGRVVRRQRRLAPHAERRVEAVGEQLVGDEPTGRAGMAHSSIGSSRYTRCHG